MRCTSRTLFLLCPFASGSKINRRLLQQAAALAGIQTTGCKSTEIECICKATAFLTALKSALSSICSEADQQSMFPSPPKKRQIPPIAYITATATIAFAISLCDSVGQSIAVPSSQAAEALPSEIPIPTDTSTPIETAILIYADGASSAVVDEPSTTAPTEAGSISSPVYYDTTTYISDSASLTVSTYLTSSVSPPIPTFQEPPSTPSFIHPNSKLQPLTSPPPSQDPRHRRRHIPLQKQHGKQQHRDRQKAHPVPRPRRKSRRRRLDCAVRSVSRRSRVGALVVRRMGWMDILLLVLVGGYGNAEDGI